MFETAQIDQILPSSYEAGWYLEAIEACDSTLVYEGFANLKNLTSLTYLDLSYCPKIDTWCMDRITGEYADTLEYLDLSGCKNLQATSLEPIWRLSKLKTLVLRDMMMLDIFPNLEIRGVDYIDISLLKGSEDEDLLKDDILMLKSEK
jgi:Leucine-rich repeat (LRR) protein